MPQARGGLSASQQHPTGDCWSGREQDARAPQPVFGAEPGPARPGAAAGGRDSQGEQRGGGPGQPAVGAALRRRGRRAARAGQLPPAGGPRPLQGAVRGTYNWLPPCPPACRSILSYCSVGRKSRTRCIWSAAAARQPTAAPPHPPFLPLAAPALLLRRASLWQPGRREPPVPTRPPLPRQVWALTRVCTLSDPRQREMKLRAKHSTLVAHVAGLSTPCTMVRAVPSQACAVPAARFCYRGGFFVGTRRSALCSCAACLAPLPGRHRPAPSLRQQRVSKR